MTGSLGKLTTTISYHSAVSRGNHANRRHLCGRWVPAAIESIGQRTGRSAPRLEQHHSSVGACTGGEHGRMVAPLSSPSEFHPVEHLQRQSTSGDFCARAGDRWDRGGDRHRHSSDSEQCRTRVASFIRGGTVDRGVHADRGVEGNVCGE